MTVEQSIREKLINHFSPEHLEVINESHGHNVAPGSETHFKVVVVSASFAEQNLVQRHRAVYGVLADELQGGVHALALHTYTSEEWEAQQVARASPDCLGGGKG